MQGEATPLWLGDPVGLPGLAAVAVGFFLFLAALFAARLRREPGSGESAATRSRASLAGIVLQGVGIGIASFGVIRLALDPLGTKALLEGGAAALLMLAAVALFLWASRTMGRNWSLVARTRDDHALVTEGPFALVRHPIYVALFLLMLALSIAFGHTRHLIVAVPLYAIGTWIRVRIEERLLRAKFAGTYDAYAARVARFVPGLF